MTPTHLYFVVSGANDTPGMFEISPGTLSENTRGWNYLARILCSLISFFVVYNPALTISSDFSRDISVASDCTPRYPRVGIDLTILKTRCCIRSI